MYIQKFWESFPRIKLAFSPLSIRWLIVNLLSNKWVLPLKLLPVKLLNAKMVLKQLGPSQPLHITRLLDCKEDIKELCRLKINCSRYLYLSPRFQNNASACKPFASSVWVKFHHWEINKTIIRHQKFSLTKYFEKICKSVKYF